MSDTADVPSHMAAYEQDGKVKKTTYTFFRGTNSNFHPTDESLDEFMQTLPPDLAGTNYFPSYEMVLNGFDHPMMEDRKHPHQHVLTFNMKAFERYYCDVGMSDADLEAAYQEARAMDLKVATQGHFAVPRTMTPAAGGAQAPKA